MGIRLERFKIDLITTDGAYGFNCKFEAGLNIIRGNNTTGKSTFVNSLIYALGMEEILGGKGTKSLPYALKDSCKGKGDSNIKIISSYVYLELSNDSEEVVTLKRSIKSENQDSKLVEVIQGPYLSEPLEKYSVLPKFLHDAGAAKNPHAGFFFFMEKFMGLNLPTVDGTKSKEVKLYLQIVLSALFVEQKRGWTDYIANTPYYAIKDVRTKIVEFLIGLDVFENDKKKNEILEKITLIKQRWMEERLKIKLIEESNAIVVSGVKGTPDHDIDLNLFGVHKRDEDNKQVLLSSYVSNLIKRYEQINADGEKVKEGVSEELLRSYQEAKDVLDGLVSTLESARTEFKLSTTRHAEYQSLIVDIEKDLEKNKVAKKLKEFGAENGLEIANDICPSCNSKVDDSLFLADTLVQPMNLDENISYLDSQRKMVNKYIIGLEKNIKTLSSQVSSLEERVLDQRKILISINKSVRLNGTTTEANLRIKLMLESQIERLNKASDQLDLCFSELLTISEDFTEQTKNLKDLPERKESPLDIKKHRSFQKSFKDYARKFGYKSAPTDAIQIHKDTLLPYFSGIELREILRKDTESVSVDEGINADIKQDSSASDFVRLIWSYLLSIYSTSKQLDGNHIGVMIFDEPGQHSMGETSVNALLKVMSQQIGLQSIVAASFDENDDVFSKSVKDVEHNFISYEDRLLSSV